MKKLALYLTFNLLLAVVLYWFEAIDASLMLFASLVITGIITCVID